MKSGTARFTVQLAIEVLIVLAVLLASFLLPGCAVRHAHQAKPDPRPREKFWQSCQETVPAIADGFQHFDCIDVRNKQYEVLVRQQPKR